MNSLDKQYTETPFYGVRRLHQWLRDKGYLVNRSSLRRLMSLVCWETLYPKPRTTTSKPDAYKYPYLLKSLDIDHPNQVWELITYIPMRKSFMYLFAIIDVYSWYVVGWSLSNTMTVG